MRLGEAYRSDLAHYLSRHRTPIATGQLKQVNIVAMLDLFNQTNSGLGYGGDYNSVLIQHLLDIFSESGTETFHLTYLVNNDDLWLGPG